MSGLEWHELNTNKTYDAESLEGQPVRFEVLSFRDVKAIVKMVNGTYELLAPEFVNDHLKNVRLFNEGEGNIKTKVEYVEYNKTANHVAKEMIDGEVFYSRYGLTKYRWGGSSFLNCSNKLFELSGSFYVKVESEIKWWDEVDTFAESGMTCHDCDSPYISADSEQVVIDGKFNHVDFLEMCKLVTDANN